MRRGDGQRRLGGPCGFRVARRTAGGSAGRVVAGWLGRSRDCRAVFFAARRTGVVGAPVGSRRGCPGRWCCTAAGRWRRSIVEWAHHITGARERFILLCPGRYRWRGLSVVPEGLALLWNRERVRRFRPVRAARPSPPVRVSRLFPLMGLRKAEFDALGLAGRIRRHVSRALRAMADSPRLRRPRLSGRTGGPGLIVAARACTRRTLPVADRRALLLA
jgi:hypothetical protein